MGTKSIEKFFIKKHNKYDRKRAYEILIHPCILEEDP